MENNTPTISKIKSYYIGKIKDAAHDKLAKTDWYIIRFTEEQVEIPQEVRNERDSVRLECNNLESSINSSETKEDLQSLMSSIIAFIR